MQFQIRDSRSFALALLAVLAFSASSRHASAQEEEQSWRTPPPSSQRTQTRPGNCDQLDTRAQVVIANINQQWGSRRSPCTQARKDRMICLERKRFVSQCLAENRAEQDRADQCLREAEERVQAVCDPDAQRRAPWLGD
jgi:hypothetical protein